MERVRSSVLRLFCAAELSRFQNARMPSLAVACQFSPAQRTSGAHTHCSWRQLVAASGVALTQNVRDVSTGTSSVATGQHRNKAASAQGSIATGQHCRWAASVRYPWQRLRKGASGSTATRPQGQQQVSEASTMGTCALDAAATVNRCCRVWHDLFHNSALMFARRSQRQAVPLAAAPAAACMHHAPRNVSCAQGS